MRPLLILWRARCGDTLDERAGEHGRRTSDRRARGGAASRVERAADFHDCAGRGDRHGIVSRQRGFGEPGWTRRDSELCGGIVDRAGADVGARRNDAGASGGRLVRRVRGNLFASVGGIFDPLRVLAGNFGGDRQRSRRHFDLLPLLVSRSARVDVDADFFCGDYQRERRERRKFRNAGILVRAYQGGDHHRVSAARRGAAFRHRIPAARH